EGFYMLPLRRQREFRFAVQARVTLWRSKDRTPRAELVIGLPTDVLALPPAPEVTVDADGWHIPLDVAEGARLAAAAGEPLELLPVEEPPEQIDLRQRWEQASAEEVVALARDEVQERARKNSESGHSSTGEKRSLGSLKSRSSAMTWSGRHATSNTK